MTFSIQAPAASPRANEPTSPGSDISIDSDGEHDAIRSTNRNKHTTVITPGEVVTDDPQWMRGHGTAASPNSTAILATVAGTLLRTNKLLSIQPLRARYTPEIGDLVVGRIVSVETKRWKVDASSEKGPAQMNSPSAPFSAKATSSSQKSKAYIKMELQVCIPEACGMVSFATAFSYASAVLAAVAASCELDDRSGRLIRRMAAAMWM
ncbi:MAG: hypothetical protein Q9169_008227 [Polycauliona sp. 2 TL-2023]